MADQTPKRTVYQEMNKLLGLDAFIGVQNKDFFNQPQILIKGDTEQDVKRKSLELQQRDYLRGKFLKVQQHGFQKAMQYEAQRLPAYVDYEGMEYYPIIAAALNLFMEESTTIGENGKMLHIYSSKERIKNTLEDLFYGTINVNTNLPFWCRNLPVKHDSMIPLLDGTELTIKEISEKLKNNPETEIWTYSVQDITNNIIPGKIIWCDLTRKSTEILRINLDDNTYLETTSDHEFLLRNGKRKRADQLVSGESLMPFYTKISKKDENNDWLIGYEKILNPSTNHYKFTHRIVSQNLLKKDNENNSEPIHTHHINFNKLNNDPINLIRLPKSEHLKIHQKIAIKILQRPDVIEKRMIGIDKYLRSESRKDRLSKEMSGIYPKYFQDYNHSELHNEHNSIRKNRMTDLWSNEEYQNKVKDKMTLKFDDVSLSYVIDIIKNSNEFIPKKELCELLKINNEFIISFKNANPVIRKDLVKSLNTTTLEKLLIRKSGLSYLELIKNINTIVSNSKKYINACNISNGKKQTKTLINHKVVSIETLKDKHDTYCMEVVGKNGEHDRHNFPICSKNLDGTYTRNGVFVSNCKYGDNFVYAYGEKDKGILFVKQMVNFEVEREDKIEDARLVTRFNLKGTNTKFENIEMAHFRLLSDDKYMPYGSSILHKIRRVWRQLIMAEDAMLTYRILRAGEKRVFKIPVGNMDEADVEAYIERVVNRFKKVQDVNPNNAQIDYRFNIMGNDEDYFIPVRSENSGTMIDTLAGAQNLDSIQDIEYLRDNLFMGLEVPRPFLSYQSAGGEGKNMAQFDVRFAKKINRVQQALLQELNKLAIIHLYYLGYRGEDLTNFKLLLTNPSTQSDILKNELLEAKARVYEALTKTTEGSIAATSHTWAKRNVLGWSDSEIIQDMKIQRIERALSQELQDTPLIIKKTGIFNDVDNRYGSGDPLPVETATSGGTDTSAAAPGAGSALPGEGSPETLRPPDENVAGGTFTSPAELPPVQSTKTETYSAKSDALLNEYINVITDKTNSDRQTKELVDNNKRLNENAFKLIKDVEALNITQEQLSAINFKDYEDSDEIYESVIKMREDILNSQINELNERKN